MIQFTVKEVNNGFIVTSVYGKTYYQTEEETLKACRILLDIDHSQLEVK